MFGEKFTTYRLRKKQTQEITEALEATLIKAWEPHRKKFFTAIEPTHSKNTRYWLFRGCALV